MWDDLPHPIQRTLDIVYAEDSKLLGQNKPFLRNENRDSQEPWRYPFHGSKHAFFVLCLVKQTVHADHFAENGYRIKDDRFHG
jgi:hypothetical protein